MSKPSQTEINIAHDSFITAEKQNYIPLKINRILKITNI